MDFIVPLHLPGYIVNSPTPSDRPFHPVTNPDGKQPDEQALERLRKTSEQNDLMDKRVLERLREIREQTKREHNDRMRHDESNGHATLYPSTGRRPKESDEAGKQDDRMDERALERLREISEHEKAREHNDRMRRMQYDESKTGRRPKEIDEADLMRRNEAAMAFMFHRRATYDEDAAMARVHHEEYKHEESDAAMARVFHEEYEHEESDAAMARKLMDSFTEHEQTLQEHKARMHDLDEQIRRIRSDPAMARVHHEEYEHEESDAAMARKLMDSFTEHEESDAAMARVLHEEYEHEESDAAMARKLMDSFTEHEHTLQEHKAMMHDLDEQSRRIRSQRTSAETRQPTTTRVHLNRTLREMRLHEKPIKGDGNCQFRAVADQLWGDEGKYDTVKQCAMAEIDRNHSRYDEFIFDPGYMASMRKDGEYGDNLTLWAIANEMGLRILVITDSPGQNVRSIQPDDEEEITRTIILAHWGEGTGDHYTSVVEDSDQTEAGAL